MLSGLHVIIYTRDAEADRAFFRDALRLKGVNAGDGWIIFAAPPTEVGFHPAEEERHELWLMCEDIEGTLKKLAAAGAKGVAPVVDQGWGLASSFESPAGTKFLIYEPRHPRATEAAASPARKRAKQAPGRRAKQTKRRARR
ncbi:MAG TPA: VOC family protein [Phycisphaerales bacterium]|nr:VOC family protein [Phycisphaerales bacterium]